MSKPKPTITTRKPPAAAPMDPAVTAKFVASGGSSSTQTSKPPDAGKRSPTTLTRTRGGERVVKRMTIYLPADLAKRLAVRCAQQERQLSDTIAEALEGWLKQNY